MKNFSKKFNYPEDFYDFSQGVDISDAEINKTIKEMLKNFKNKIKNGKKRSSYFSATGNMIVWGNFYEVSNTYVISINVSKNYASQELTIRK
jgi:hypothetical protein